LPIFLRILARALNAECRTTLPALGTEARPRAHLILSEETGRRYAADNFRHVFAEIREALAKETPRFAFDYLPPGAELDPVDGKFYVATTDLLFMHLRHTAVRRVAEARPTKPQTAAITGRSLKTVD